MITAASPAFYAGADLPFAGGGVAPASAIVQVPPNLEVVVAAGSWVGLGPGNLQVLARAVNDRGERLDPFVIEAMLEDDAAGPAFETLKTLALPGDLNFHPSVEEDDDAEDEGADPAEARRAAEFCRRAHDRLPVPLQVWGKDALNALAYGHKLAELVMEYVQVDEASGYWTLADLVMKPLHSYHLVADPFRRLVAAYCDTPAGPAYVDIDHFVVFSWDVRDGDPRGSSILRAAKDPWRRKLRAKESRSKGDDQFGTPSVVMELPPNAPAESRDPETGAAVATTVAARKELMTFQNGGAIVVPSGGKVYVIESNRDGVQLGNSIDSYDRAITTTILLSPKATMEAKHYTQGGGEIGQDLMTEAAEAVGNRWFLSILRKQVFWRLLARNRGEAYADLYTPRLSLGQRLSDNFVGLVNAIAVMAQAGMLTPSQIVGLLADAGVPRPRPGELRVGPSGPIPDELPPPAPAPATPETNPAPAAPKEAE